MLCLLTLAGAFHTGRGVDGVSEQTVSGHRESHHTGTARSGVNPDAQLELLRRSVPDPELPGRRLQLQRHPAVT